MLDFFQGALSGFRWLDIIDIVILTGIIYFLLKLIVGTRAEQLVKGLIVVLIIAFISSQFGLSGMNWFLSQLFTISLVAIPIIFQQQLRQALEKLGRGEFIQTSSFLFGESEEQVNEMIDEVLKAVRILIKRRYGALLVFERMTHLEEHTKDALQVDAKVSAELLVSLFTPGNPTHDGAVVISNGRVQVSNCLLPLTDNPNLSKELGTRHRAALGVSEESDAMVLVISEENGVASLARSGKLTRYLDEKTLKQMLTDSLIENKGQRRWPWRVEK